jgi:hypothetical protein
MEEPVYNLLLELKELLAGEQMTQRQVERCLGKVEMTLAMYAPQQPTVTDLVKKKWWQG